MISAGSSCLPGSMIGIEVSAKALPSRHGPARALQDGPLPRKHEDDIDRVEVFEGQYCIKSKALDTHCDLGVERY